MAREQLLRPSPRALLFRDELKLVTHCLRLLMCCVAASREPTLSATDGTMWGYGSQIVLEEQGAEKLACMLVHLPMVTCNKGKQFLLQNAPKIVSHLCRPEPC